MLVADKVVLGKDKEPAKTEARSAEELKALENMVASALGLDTNRGDKIEVTSMPFLQSDETQEGQGVMAGGLYQYAPFIRYGFLLLGGLLLYLLMIKPLVKTLSRDVTRHYKTVEQLEAEQAGGGAGQQDQAAVDPLHRIKKEVDADPAFGAHALRNWIQDRS